MMNFDLKEVLNTAAPTASLVFASWLFLQLLNMRFEGAMARYERAIDEYREGKADEKRKETLYELISLHGRRCVQMRRALHTGLLAAMLLVLSLVAATIHLAFGAPVPKVVTLVCSITGLSLIIAAAAMVMVENHLGRPTLRRQFEDIPELVDRRTEAQADKQGLSTTLAPSRPKS